MYDSFSSMEASSRTTSVLQKSTENDLFFFVMFPTAILILQNASINRLPGIKYIFLYLFIYTHTEKICVWTIDRGRHCTEGTLRIQTVLIVLTLFLFRFSEKHSPISTKKIILKVCVSI